MKSYKIWYNLSGGDIQNISEEDLKLFNSYILKSVIFNDQILTYLINYLKNYGITNVKNFLNECKRITLFIEERRYDTKITKSYFNFLLESINSRYNSMSQIEKNNLNESTTEIREALTDEINEIYSLFIKKYEVNKSYQKYLDNLIKDNNFQRARAFLSKSFDVNNRFTEVILELSREEIINKYFNEIESLYKRLNERLDIIENNYLIGKSQPKKLQVFKSQPKKLQVFKSQIPLD